MLIHDYTSRICWHVQTFLTVLTTCLSFLFYFTIFPKLSLFEVAYQIIKNLNGEIVSWKSDQDSDTYLK